MFSRPTLLRVLALVSVLFLPTLLFAGEVRTLSGAAHNVTVGVRAAVTLHIAQGADGSYRLSGGFDNVNLGGDVTATGTAPLFEDAYPACAAGHECIVFTGQIMLDQRVGFDDGTVTSFILSLDIEAATGSAVGVYHIGLLPGLGFEQYGTVNLSLPIS